MKRALVLSAVALMVVLAALPSFAEPSAFRYAENADGTLTVTGYTGFLSDLILPEQVNGKTITAIGDSAFMNQTELVRVVLPASVTTIGAEAFCGCTRLVEVTLSAVTDIGMGAFADCTSLRDVTLGDALVHIGAAAFEHCKQLGTLAIPATLASIDTDAFFGCEQLRFSIGENEYARTYAAANNIPLSVWESDGFLFGMLVLVAVVLSVVGWLAVRVWKRIRARKRA